MGLSKNQNIFSEFFAPFPKFTLNFEYFGKKEEPQMLLVSESIDCKMRGYLNA